jgi:hypothetical protein
VGVTVTGWYATDAAWWAPLDRDARRRLGPALRHRYGPARLRHREDTRTLSYFVDGLDVVGDRDPVDVEIRFYAEPPYDTYGLAPSEYPRVFAKPGASSKHRQPDGSLCLWTPWDPPDRRWTADKGLLELIELTRQHLFLENYWRRFKVWLVQDSPHGLPRPAASRGRTVHGARQRSR